MSARRLLTVVWSMLAETRTPDELEALLNPPAPDVAAADARRRRQLVAARYGTG